MSYNITITLLFFFFLLFPFPFPFFLFPFFIFHFTLYQLPSMDLFVILSKYIHMRSCFEGFIKRIPTV
jgi:hypothetical protein